MDVQTVLAYLLGSWTAIERVAADPWAVWVGLALVASAGLARSYASRDLLRQPWHLVLPGVAALALSLALSIVLVSQLIADAEAPPWPVGFRSVASLVLLTSPLAWLYAIPYERFLPHSRVVRARLITLGVVAGWRVALVVRALTVLLDGRGLAALCIVLLVCDVLALLGLWATSLLKEKRRLGETETPRLLAVMGGIQTPDLRSPEHRLMGRITIAVAVAGALTLPLWWLGITRLEISAQTWLRLLSASEEWGTPTPAVWALAGVPFLAFIALLPWTQRAPRLRSQVERLFRSSQVAEALRLMSAHRREDFPSGWSPPPEEDFRAPPTLLDVLEEAFSSGTADWVRGVYLQRFRDYLSAPLWYWYYDQDLERVAGLLARLSEGAGLARLVLDSVRTFENVPDRDLVHFPADSEENREGRFSFFLYPEPVPTGRRNEIVAAIERLSGQKPSDGDAS